MTPRPDERAAEYQEGRDKSVRKSVIGGASALASITPFLSQYVPADLAMKGINKVFPQIGKFLKKGQSMGLDLREGLDFLKDKIGSKEPAKEDRNIIEQESPELFSFLDQAIKGGRNPIEAAAIAQQDKRFAPIIQKLMKAHKTPWSSIIESIFGSGDQGKAAALQQFNARKNPGMAEGLQQQFQGQYGQQPQQGQQGQGLDPAIAQLIQQGNAILQKFKGQQ
jgi:hypothetical protein